MKKAVNLANRDGVFEHAQAIYEAVSSGHMPPAHSREARWSTEMCARFKNWCEQRGPQ